MADSVYLHQCVGEPLRLCLTELVTKMPPDPIEWMAQWLYRFMDSEMYYLEKTSYLNNMIDTQIKITKEMNCLRRNINFLKRENEKLAPAENENLKKVKLSPLGKLLAGRSTIVEMLDKMNFSPLNFLIKPTKKSTTGSIFIPQMPDPQGAGMYFSVNYSDEDSFSDDDLPVADKKMLPLPDDLPRESRASELELIPRKKMSSVRHFKPHEKASPAYMPFVPWETGRQGKQKTMTKHQVENIIVKARDIPPFSDIGLWDEEESSAPRDHLQMKHSIDFSKFMDLSEEEYTQAIADLSPESFARLANTMSVDKFEQLVAGMSPGQFGRLAAGMSASDFKRLAAGMSPDELARLVAGLTPEEFGRLIKGMTPDEFGRLVKKIPPTLFRHLMTRLDPEEFGNLAKGLSSESYLNKTGGIPYGDFKKLERPLSDDVVSLSLWSKEKEMGKDMVGEATWGLDPNFGLICDHPILGMMSGKRPFAPPETPEWWQNQCYQYNTLYDPEVYSCDAPDKMSMWDSMPHLTYADFLPPTHAEFYRLHEPK